MDGQDLGVLVRRIERLERECRRWRRAGAAALIGATAVLGGVAAMRAPSELRVERIVIQDGQDGRKSIVLGVQDGSPALTFLDGDSEQIALRAPVDGPPSLALLDGGKFRMVLGLSRNGAPILNLNDEHQRRRIALGIFAKVGPMISALDENNKVTFQAPPPESPPPSPAPTPASNPTAPKPAEGDRPAPGPMP